MSNAAPSHLRSTLLRAGLAIAGGSIIKGLSPETIRDGGYCAQLQRETVESALDMNPNTWEVAVLAHEFRKARGGVVRWAADYEQAGRKLGLNKDPEDAVPGDIFYWPYTVKTRDGKTYAYGHTAMFLGDVRGLGPAVLENSDASPAHRRERGALVPLGSGTHVYVTPLRVLGRPTTCITPTLKMLKEERPETPTPAGYRALLSMDHQPFKVATGGRLEIRRAQLVVINLTDPETVRIRVVN